MCEQRAGRQNRQHKPDSVRLREQRTDKSSQMLRRQLCATQPGNARASASQGAHRPSLPSCSHLSVGAGARQKQKKEKKKHELSRAEQTGFTELLSSQAPIPCTALVAHSLLRGLWAVKYGFMCAHITFGSRETFKSNYDECYLHELLF